MSLGAWSQASKLLAWMTLDEKQRRTKNDIGSDSVVHLSFSRMADGQINLWTSQFLEKPRRVFHVFVPLPMVLLEGG